MQVQVGQNLKYDVGTLKAPDSSSSSSNIPTIAGASVAVVVVVLVVVGALIIVIAIFVRKARKRDYRLYLMELKKVDERVTGKELCTCEIYLYTAACMSVHCRAFR